MDDVESVSQVRGKSGFGLARKRSAVQPKVMTCKWLFFLKFQGQARPEKSPGNGSFAALPGAAFSASGAPYSSALSGAKRARR
jgi:hypothetical protein